MKKCLAAILAIITILSISSCNKEEYKDTNYNKEPTFLDIESIAEEVKIIKPAVTFNTNGGTKIKSKDTFLIENEPLTTREDHYFDGWFFDTTFNSPVQFPLSIEHDTTLQVPHPLGK